MDQSFKKDKKDHAKPSGDRIEGDTIFLDVEGYFPKKLITIDRCQRKLKGYLVVKSPGGKLQLNKWETPIK